MDHAILNSAYNDSTLRKNSIPVFVNNLNYSPNVMFQRPTTTNIRSVIVYANKRLIYNRKNYCTEPTLLAFSSYGYLLLSSEVINNIGYRTGGKLTSFALVQKKTTLALAYTSVVSSSLFH